MVSRAIQMDSGCSHSPCAVRRPLTLKKPFFESFANFKTGAHVGQANMGRR